MKQYINKAAVVAEINRRIILLENNSDGIISMLASGMFVNEYKDLLSFLDTLEVKEVDLEKEIDKYLTDNYWALEGNDNSPYLVGKDDMLKLAKYFFELGMQQSKNHNNNEE